MKTSSVIGRTAHVNGHTFLHGDKGSVSVAAYWNHEGAKQVTILNIAFLATGNSYTYHMDSESVRKPDGEEVGEHNAEIDGIMNLVTLAKDDQNEILFVNTPPREAIPEN